MNTNMATAYLGIVVEVCAIVLSTTLSGTDDKLGGRNIERFLFTRVSGAPRQLTQSYLLLDYSHKFHIVASITNHHTCKS